MLKPRVAPLLLLLLLSACGGSQNPDSPRQTRLLSTQVSGAQPVAADYHTVVQQIYVAYFGRPADVGGLAWHATVLQAAGAPTDIVALSNAYNSNAALKAEIDSFGTSKESSDLYPGDNGQFVDALYRNLFGRTPDAGGRAWWVSVLDSGAITRASAAIQIMAGSQGSDTTIVNNKTRVASDFTARIVTPIQQQGYDGLAANVVVRTVLGQVGEATDTAAFAGTIGATVTTLAATVAAASGWDVSPVPPAMNSVSAIAPKILATPVVAAGTGAAAAPPVPSFLAPAPAGTNLKLWIYDPRSTSGIGLATGIFLQNVTANSSWQFVGANSDGSLYLQLAAGDYQFDTVEPNGMASTFQRHRYQVSVSAAGAAAITRDSAISQGVYPVTLDMTAAAATPEAKKLQEALQALAVRPASAFKPTSLCQMMDQVTPDRSFATDLSAGFPKVRTRLKSFGRIRALIIPVDFPAVAGKDDPGAYFTPLANDVRDFYQKQSYGRLTFDFEIVPNWVRMPFSPGDYGFTSANGSGDFTAYRNAIFAMTDKQIDYSKYDAVYILVPKEMPMSQVGYGPAITAPTWTSTGYVTNGATGGADMYFNEANGVPGAQWKWMAHETGHAFGLYDEDLNHASATLGSWSIMANSWSSGAIENNGWDRYLQGWLPEEQVACHARTALAGGASVTLSPLVRQDTRTKAAMVPLSATKILVIESRKNEGYDKLDASQEGVLVYTVDMTVGTLRGGYRTQRRPGSVDASFRDAALRAGDSITVEGVTVTVSATSADADTITLRAQ
ncbi:MAG TPA: DUF4214 domain-containing protein [Telluria sp.]|nr:DUF4214 domain-containing protein [Telluria sp.]